MSKRAYAVTLRFCGKVLSFNSITALSHYDAVRYAVFISGAPLGVEITGAIMSHDAFNKCASTQNAIGFTIKANYA